MLSGIGDGEALRALGIEATQHLPGVGANYHDHLAAGILMEMSNSESYGISLRAAPRGAWNLLEYALFRRGPFASNVFEANAFVRSAPDRDRPDLQIVFQPARRNPGTFPFPLGHGFALSVVHLYPRSRGRVSLASPDPHVATCRRPEPARRPRRPARRRCAGSSCRGGSSRRPPLRATARSKSSRVSRSRTRLALADVRAPRGVHGSSPGRQLPHGDGRQRRRRCGAACARCRGLARRGRVGVSAHRGWQHECSRRDGGREGRGHDPGTTAPLPPFELTTLTRIRRGAMATETHQALEDRRRRSRAHRRGQQLGGRHRDAAAGRQARVRAEVSVAGAALRDPRRQDADLLSMLRAQVTRQVRDDRHLHRQRPAARISRVLQHADDVSRGPRRCRLPAREHRHRDVFAPALRPRGVEHAQGRRQVGADLPAGALSLRQEGIRALAAPARNRRLPQLRSPGRFGRPDRRGQSARAHRDGSRHHRRGVAGAHAGPHAWPRQRAHPLARRGSRHHRRHDAPPDPARRPGDARQLRHGQGAGREDAPRIRRALRQQESHDHRHALLRSNRRHGSCAMATRGSSRSSRGYAVMAIQHDFSDLTVLVTGAGRGLGRSVAEKLASCGATVGLLDIDAASCEAAAARIRDDRGPGVCLRDGRRGSAVRSRRLRAGSPRSAAASTPWSTTRCCSATSRSRR